MVNQKDLAFVNHKDRDREINFLMDVRHAQTVAGWATAVKLVFLIS